MKNKGFKDLSAKIETPNNFSETEKPLKPILKSKLQDTENKEFKKNLIILVALFTLLGILGINLSL